jgi:hypothetical protein
MVGVLKLTGNSLAMSVFLTVDFIIMGHSLIMICIPRLVRLWIDHF